MTDLFTGMYAVVAMLAALEHRRRAGERQYIDLSLLDVQVATLSNQAINYLTSGEVPRRLGNAHPNVAPYEAFPTANGHIILAVGNDGQFGRFCSAAGRPDQSADTRFATNAARVQNRGTLIPELAALMSMRSTNHWLDVLEAARVPCGPINTLDQVFDNPQVRHREMCVNVAHPAGAELRLVTSPIKFSATPASQAQAPPLLRQHTDEVLSELIEVPKDAIEH